MKNKPATLIRMLSLTLILSAVAFSQSHILTYQGKLSDTGAPPTGTYQMEFRLFDSLSGSGQIGTVVPNNAVTVVDGLFTVSLNFGGATTFTGADRFLQISVRRNAGESFVILNPRQQIASSPYSIRTLSAAQADDSAQLGGVPAGQYLQTNGNGTALTNLNASSITTGTLNNARLGQLPTANIADNAVTAPKIAVGQVVKGVTVGPITLADNVTLVGGANTSVTSAGNTVTIASTGGGNAILNQSTPQQAGANFNIGGSGTLGGTLTANAVTTETGSGFYGLRHTDGATTIGTYVGGGSGGASGGWLGTQTNSSLHFFTNNGQSRMTVTPAGRVGIGTTAPAAELEVIGNIRTTFNTTVCNTGLFCMSVSNPNLAGAGARITSGSPERGGEIGQSSAAAHFYGGSTFIKGDSTPLPAFFGKGIVMGFPAGANAGYISAFDYGTFTAQDLLLNGPGGRVGIGNTAPQAKLDITAIGDGAELLRFTTDRPWLVRQVRTGATAGLQLASTSGQKAFEITTNDGSNVATFFADSTVSKVGIGTTAPTATLDVNGNVRVRDITAGPPVGDICGDSSFQLVSCETSSLRLKTDVHPFSDGLNILRQLRPISYRWKDGGAYDIGLGAEDVAEVAPFFAVRNKDGVIEGVRYQRLNILLINAINQQQEQIEQQRREIESLKQIVCPGNAQAEFCRQK